MDKKTKIFFWVFFLLTFVSLGVTYHRFVIAENFLIDGQVACDPAVEVCFVSECDPLLETCTGDPAQDTTYYKVISRLAKNIPLCDPADADCSALSCPEGEAGCMVTYCDPTDDVEDVLCSDAKSFPGEEDAEELIE